MIRRDAPRRIDFARRGVATAGRRRGPSRMAGARGCAVHGPPLRRSCRRAGCHAGEMAEPEHSKRAMNRAGERLRASSRGSVRPLDGPELDAAREIVDHWRALHAVPLSKVAAGLRYYVRKAGADERSVSQRLKRFDTIVES